MENSIESAAENKSAIAKTLDIKRCFKDAYAVSRVNVQMLVFLFIPVIIVGLVTWGILFGPLLGCYYFMLLDAMRREDKKINPNLLFQWKYAVILFFALIIKSILMLAGYWLFVIPGLLLTTLFLFVELLIIDKGTGFLGSFKTASKIIIKKGILKNIVIALIVTVLTFGIGTFSFVFLATTLSLFITAPFLLLVFVIMPFTMLLVVSAYIQQIDEDKGELSGIV